MAAVNPATGHYEEDRHGEADPARPDDRWCAGCIAWPTTALVPPRLACIAYRRRLDAYLSTSVCTNLNSDF